MADFKIQSSIQIDTAYIEAQLDALRAQFEAFRARLTDPIPLRLGGVTMPVAPLSAMPRMGFDTMFENQPMTPPAAPSAQPSIAPMASTPAQPSVSSATDLTVPRFGTQQLPSPGIPTMEMRGLSPAQPASSAQGSSHAQPASPAQSPAANASLETPPSSLALDTTEASNALAAFAAQFEAFRARLTDPIPIRMEGSGAEQAASSMGKVADAASSAAQSTSQLGDVAARGTSRFKALLSSVSSMAGGLLNSGISWGTAFLKGIASGMQTGWSAVKTTGGILVKGIAGIFSIGSLTASWGLGIARGIANGLRGGISFITGVARSIISGVTGIIRSGISAAGSIARALDPASQMQQYGITMDVLLKDPQKAKDRLAELKKFAGETNFDIREVVESSNLMQAFGIHGDGIARLRLAGDAANAFGKDIREVVTSLNYLGSGRGGEAFESLARIGVTRDKLKPYGVEFNAQGSLITPTKKALDAVFKYFEKEYGGMTARMGKTWAGALKIAGSEWFNALSDGFSKALAPLTSFVNDSITPLIRSLGSFLKTQDLGGMLRKPLELAKGFTTHIRRFLDPATHKQGVSEFKNLGAAIMESGQRLLTAFGFIGTGLVQSLGKIMENFYGKGGMRTVVEALVNGLATIGNFFLDTFKVILDSFSDRFKSNLLVAIEKIFPGGENEETNKRAKAEATARKEVIEEFATKIQEGKIKLPEDIDQQTVDKKIQEKAREAKYEFLKSQGKVDIPTTYEGLNINSVTGELEGTGPGLQTVSYAALDDATLQAKFPDIYKQANEVYQEALKKANTTDRNRIVAEMLLDRNNGEMKAEFDRRVAVGMGWQDADSHRAAGYARTMESGKKLWGDIGKAISVNMQGASEPIVRSIKYAGKLGIGEPIVNELQGEAKFHQFDKARDSWNAYYDRQKEAARKQIDQRMQAETHLSKKERESLRQTRYDRADEIIEQQRKKKMREIAAYEKRYSSQLTEYRQTQRERRAAETRRVVEEFNREAAPDPSDTGRGDAPAQSGAVSQTPVPFAAGLEPDRGDKARWARWYKMGGWRNYANTYARDENGKVYGYTDRNGVFGYGEMNENGEFQAHDALNSRQFKPPKRSKQTREERIEELKSDIRNYETKLLALEGLFDPESNAYRERLETLHKEKIKEIDKLERSAPGPAGYDKQGNPIYKDMQGNRHTLQYRKDENGNSIYVPKTGAGFIRDKEGNAVGYQDARGNMVRKGANGAFLPPTDQTKTSPWNSRYSYRYSPDGRVVGVVNQDTGSVISGRLGVGGRFVRGVWNDDHTQFTSSSQQFFRPKDSKRYSYHYDDIGRVVGIKDKQTGTEISGTLDKNNNFVKGIWDELKKNFSYSRQQFLKPQDSKRYEYLLDSIGQIVGLKDKQTNQSIGGALDRNNRFVKGTWEDGKFTPADGRKWEPHASAQPVISGTPAAQTMQFETNRTQAQVATNTKSIADNFSTFNTKFDTFNTKFDTFNLKINSMTDYLRKVLGEPEAIA